MKTERIFIDRRGRLLDNSLLNDIAARIKKGAVFVYPTETIYGVGGSTIIASVSDAIYEAKKRPQSNQLIHLAGRNDVFNNFFNSAPSVAKHLAKIFWPGLLTIIVPAENNPGGIAIRVSDNPFVSMLYSVIDFPIYSTSANLSGEPYNPDPDYIYEKFNGRVDFMIDAGVLPPSRPSTIVKVLDESTVQIIREGVLTMASIRNAFDNAGLDVRLAVQ